MPDPGTDEEGFIARVAEIEGPAVAFPTHDPPLNALARNLDRLPDLALSISALVGARGDSGQAPPAGGGHRGRGRHTEDDLSSADARTAADEIGLPVLVKPQHPDGFKRSFGRQAFRCETLDEVERAYADAEPFGAMVQELVPGGDEELYSLGSYLREDGSPLGLFSGRKLKQVPPGIGTCRMGEAVWVQEVVDSGLRLMRGSATASRRSSSSATPRRALQADGAQPAALAWHGLASACGVDLPVIAYRDLTGETVEPVSMNGSGRVWTISFMPGERPALTRPPYVDAVFARDDLTRARSRGQNRARRVPLIPDAIEGGSLGPRHDRGP